MVDVARLQIEADSRQVKTASGDLDRLSMSAGKAAKAAGVLAAAYTAMKVLEPIIRITAQYETALVGVAKTTGLAGKELQDFSKNIDSVSRSLPISTQELLELSQAAGQMGVTGAKNIEKFAITVAKLGRASDLAGEEAAKSLARILNVTGEAVSEIDTLASVIVSLGNNSAASESEIARMTTEVARATGVFGVSSAEAAAMAASMASIGIQAELGGSAVGRSMQAITNAVKSGGQELRDFADVLGLNANELTRIFEQDKTKAFEYFLRNVGELGLGAGAALKEVGLGGQEIAKTIIPLANNMDIFAKSMNLANEEVRDATALDREFEATLKTLGSQWQVTKNIAESYARSIGGVLVPIINKALSVFNSFASTTEYGGIIWFFDELGLRLNNFFSTKEAAQIKAVSDASNDLNSEFAAIPGTIQAASTPASRLLAKLKKDAESASGKTGNGGVKSLNLELERQRREAELTASEINRLTREYDPLFKRNEDLARLLELRAQGLPESIFNAAAAKAINDYMDATRQVEESLETTESAHEKLGVTARNVFDDTSQYAIQAARNIQSSLANALANSFNDFGNFADNVLGVFKNLAAQIASSNILKGLGFGGLIAGSSAAGASGLDVANAGFGLANLFSSGFGIPSFVGGGLSSIGSSLGLSGVANFGAGLAGTAATFTGPTAFIGGAGTALGGSATGAAAGLGSSLASFAGPAAIAAIADIGLRQIFGDKKLGGTAGDILSFVPVVGTLINGLFGRGAPKFNREELVGNVTASGFTGVLNQGFKEKGGLARRSRFSNFIADTDTGELLNQFGRLSESGNIPSSLKGAADPAIKKALEVGQLLDDTFINLGKTMENTAEILGISSDGLKNFSAELDLVSEKGETLSEAQISEAIADISNQMVSALIPSIDELSRSGETATDALVRIGAEFQALENALIVSGAGIQEARDQIQALTLEQRTAIADQFGGAAALQSEVQNFFSNVLNDAQQLDIVEKQVKSVAEGFGLNFIPTLDQLAKGFRDGSVETKALILQHDNLLTQYHSLKEAVEGVADSSEDASIKIRQILANERRSFTAGRREQQLNPKKALVAITISGRIYTEDEIRAMQQAAVDQATTMLQNIVKEQLSRLGESYREAQSFIKDQIDAVKEANRFFDGLKDDFLEISTSSRAAAHEQLNAAIELAKSGADISLIDTPELANAIKTLKEDRTDLFSTREAFEMDRAKAANSILELSRLGVTRSDETLNTLKEQLDVMKSSFEVQEQFLNAQLRFSGVNDASLLSDQELNSRDALNSLIGALAIQAGTRFNGSVTFADPRPGEELDRIKAKLQSQFNALVPTTGTSFDFSDMAQAIKDLKTELTKVKESSDKTANILDNVTRGGRAMQTA